MLFFLLIFCNWTLPQKICLYCCHRYRTFVKTIAFKFAWDLRCISCARVCAYKNFLLSIDLAHWLNGIRINIRGKLLCECPYRGMCVMLWQIQMGEQKACAPSKFWSATFFSFFSFVSKCFKINLRLTLRASNSSAFNFTSFAPPLL